MTGVSGGGVPLVMGLLVTGERTLPAWQIRMLERLRAEGLARVAVIIVRHEAPRRGLGAVLEGRALAATRVVDEAFAPLDALPELAGAQILHAASSAAGSYTAADIEWIATHRLDLLLHLGGELPRGAILDVARLGLWTHWSEDQPEGFWEVHENRAEIRTTLRHLTTAGASVLYESSSSVDPTCVVTTRNRAYAKTADFVPRILRRLRSTGSLALGNAAASRQLPARRRPSTAVLAEFLFERFLRRRQARFLKRFSREQWQLRYAFGPATRTDYERFTPLVPPVDRGWADPHVIVRNDRHYVFIEEYSYSARRGHIAVIELREDGSHGEPVRILERPYHLSYPHLFEWGGELYMLPESRANRTIEVYRCIEFPYRWQFEANLMENVEAVDTTLLEHNGRWWLFANLVANPGGSSWDELFLFSADSPLSREWTPHPANPIVSDVTRARPAGKIFSEEGRLYRPSQDCSRRYGYGLNLSEIVVLDETRYEERVVNRTRPDWDPTIFATHTLAHGGGLTVIDGQRRRWRLPLGDLALAKRLNRALRWLAPSGAQPRASTD